MKLSDMAALEVPKGATHFVLDNDGFSAAWYKREGVELYGMPMDVSRAGDGWAKTPGCTRALRDLKTDIELKFERERLGK